MRNRIAGLGFACSATTAVALVSLAALATGCTPTEYIYVPTVNATADATGHPGRDYMIPPDAPRGDVEVASTGLTSLHANDDPNRDIGAIHIRLVVSNSSDREWRVNTMGQSIAIEGHGSSAPAFASADKGTQPPLVTIPPMSKRTIDLFFPLPPSLQDADAVPSFDALWSVDTGAGLVSQRTGFQRYEVDSDPYPVGYYDYGVGGPYWINPYYGYYGYYGLYGGVYFGPRYWGHGVYIHRGPYGGFHGGGYHGSPGYHGGGGFHGGGGGHGGGHR